MFLKIFLKNISLYSDGLPCPLQHPVKPREVSLSLDFLSISHSRTSSLLSSVAVPELPSPMVPDKSPQVSCDWWRSQCIPLIGPQVQQEMALLSLGTPHPAVPPRVPNRGPSSASVMPRWGENKNIF